RFYRFVPCRREEADWGHGDRGSAEGCRGIPRPPCRSGVRGILGGYRSRRATAPGVRVVWHPAFSTAGHVSTLPIHRTDVAAGERNRDDLVVRRVSSATPSRVRPLRAVPGGDG